MLVKDVVLGDIIGGGILDWQETEEILQEFARAGYDLTEEYVDYLKEFLSVGELGQIDPTGAVYQLVADKANAILGDEYFETCWNYMASSIWLNEDKKDEFYEALKKIEYADELSFIKKTLELAGEEVNEYGL